MGEAPLANMATTLGLVASTTCRNSTLIQIATSATLIQAINTTCRELFSGAVLKAPVKIAAHKPLGAKSGMFAPSFNALPIAVRREIHSAMRGTSIKSIGPDRQVHRRAI